MDRETTRQRIARHLRDSAATPSELAAEVGTDASTVTDHVEHLARSLDAGDERLLVAPPRCRECGFDGFDDKVTRPSKCPQCRSESIAEPTFVIE